MLIFFYKRSSRRVKIGGNPVPVKLCHIKLVMSSAAVIFSDFSPRCPKAPMKSFHFQETIGGHRKGLITENWQCQDY